MKTCSDLTTSLWSLALVTGLLVIPTSVAAEPDDDGSRSVAGSVRAGMEYDDNALRVEGDEVPDDVLARYFTSLELLSRAGTRGIASLSVDHGGKFFTEQSDADTLLTQVKLGYRHRLHRHFGVHMQLDMKDRTERKSALDYNRGGAGGGLDVYLGDLTVRADGAWRYFAYKPSPSASSTNVEGSLRLRYRLVVDGLSVFSGYTVARRFFETNQLLLVDDDGAQVFRTGEEDRGDTFHVALFGISYRGPVVVSLAYSYALNLSNSYGQELTRNSVDLTGTFPLFWQFYVSAHIELQRTAYQDPVLIDANFIVDEDNRNAFVVSLARPFFENWEVEARYSLYLQEFGVGSDYQRQTALLAVGYLFD